MDRSHIEYMEQCSGDSQITIGLRHMSKLNIGDFYLTLNRPGFSESCKAGAGFSCPPCVTSLFESQ